MLQCLGSKCHLAPFLGLYIGVLLPLEQRVGCESGLVVIVWCVKMLFLLLFGMRLGSEGMGGVFGNRFE